jgi:hypothetical protein
MACLTHSLHQCPQSKSSTIVASILRERYARLPIVNNDDQSLHSLLTESKKENDEEAESQGQPQSTIPQTTDMSTTFHSHPDGPVGDEVAIICVINSTTSEASRALLRVAEPKGSVSLIA